MTDIFGAPKHGVGNRYHIAYLHRDRIFVSRFTFSAGHIARDRLERLNIVPWKKFSVLVRMLPEGCKGEIYNVSDIDFFGALGVSLRDGLDRIKKQPNGRKPTISAEVAAQIRLDDLAGVGRKAISERYGVAQSTISQIVNLARRTDVPEDSVTLPLATREGRDAARMYAQFIRSTQPEAAEMIEKQIVEMMERVKV